MERKNPMTERQKCSVQLLLAQWQPPTLRIERNIKKQQSNSLSILLISLVFANAQIEELLAL